MPCSRKLTLPVIADGHGRRDQHCRGPAGPGPTTQVPRYRIAADLAAGTLVEVLRRVSAVADAGLAALSAQPPAFPARAACVIDWRDAGIRWTTGHRRKPLNRLGPIGCPRSGRRASDLQLGDRVRQLCARRRLFLRAPRSRSCATRRGDLPGPSSVPGSASPDRFPTARSPDSGAAAPGPWRFCSRSAAASRTWTSKRSTAPCNVASRSSAWRTGVAMSPF